jgi:hypothetical protein
MINGNRKSIGGKDKSAARIMMFVFIEKLIISAV